MKLREPWLRRHFVGTRATLGGLQGSVPAGSRFGLLPVGWSYCCGLRNRMVGRSWLFKRVVGRLKKFRGHPQVPQWMLLVCALVYLAFLFLVRVQEC